MNVIREIISSDIAMIISFLCTIISILQWFLPRSLKDKLINIISQNNLRSWFIVLILSVIYLFAPTFLIIKSFEWSGWIFWLVQFLSWYMVVSFIIASYLIYWTRKKALELLK